MYKLNNGHIPVSRQQLRATDYNPTRGTVAYDCLAGDDRTTHDLGGVLVNQTLTYNHHTAIETWQ